MEKETGYHISTFDKDDIIIRVQSRIIERPAGGMMGMVGFGFGIVEMVRSEDTSYRKEPIKLVAIENGNFYYKSFSKHADKEKIHHALVDEYGDHWMPFTVPEGMTFEQCIE